MKKLCWLCILVFTAFTSSSAQQVQSVEPQVFQETLMQYHEPILVDVRTDQEVATGMIPGAIHVDIRRRDFDNQLRQYDPNTPVFVYCAMGGRSMRAAQRLASLGFTRVYDLKGGMNAWLQQGKPVKQP